MLSPIGMKAGVETPVAGKAGGGAQPAAAVAVLSRSGKLVYSAMGARGLIAVYDATTLRLHDIIRVSSSRCDSSGSYVRYV